MTSWRKFKPKLRHPTEYKTRFGLYNAVIKVLDAENMPLSVAEGWWLQAAYDYCEQKFPDLLPQLNKLRSSKATADQLIPIQ